MTAISPCASDTVVRNKTHAKIAAKGKDSVEHKAAVRFYEFKQPFKPFYGSNEDRLAGHDNTDWCACEYFQQLPGSSFCEVVQEVMTGTMSSQSYDFIPRITLNIDNPVGDSVGVAPNAIYQFLYS